MGSELALVGLILSMVYIGFTGLYPGGLIVPGYLMLFADQPLRLVATLLVAGLTWLSFHWFSRFVILFGRRRFVFCIMAGAVWTYLWLQVVPELLPLSPEFRVIGWVVPGLIANHFERQGVWLTTASMIIVVAGGYFLGKLILVLLNIY